MSKTTTAPETEISKEKIWLPIKEFYDHFANRSSPYKSHFSLAPFLEKMKLKSESTEGALAPEIKKLADEIEKELSVRSEEPAFLKDPRKLETLISLLFPSLFFEGQLGFLSIPFRNFVFLTADMKTLMYSDEWEVKMPDFLFRSELKKPIVDIANLILKTFYNTEGLDWISSEVMTVRNKKTKLEKHFKVNIIHDFVRAKNLKPVKELTELQLHNLLSNLDDAKLWQEYIPPENFAFEGILIGTLIDVTAVEILSRIKEMMVNEGGKADHIDDLTFLEQSVRSILTFPEISFGMIHTSNNFWVESTSWSLLRQYDVEIIPPSFKDEKGSYGKTLNLEKAVIIPDLKAQKHLSKIEVSLVEKGYRSLIVAPMFEPNGKIIGVFELASPLPYRFNQLTLIHLNEFIDQLAIGTVKFIQDLDNQIRLTIQQQFTSIHPCVEWRFREVASKFYWQKVIEQKKEKLEPIVFNDIYPLYAQSDIVGSSKLRNKCIQADLKDNLEKVIELMVIFRERINFHLLDIYLKRAMNCLERLEKGAYTSSDESQIVEMLTQEIHPLLRELLQQFPKLPKKASKAYFEYVDPNFDIVYRHRKDYEESVNNLREVIASYIEKDDEKMQKVLHHYFEKYVTDGVEYNIYLGQSLLENGLFSDYFLKDFRLWQLIQMCAITRLVEQTKKDLPIPLSTAQLIFVYNNPLSIRFHTDQKQFDVDGAYNVRYEILKKRIDKAVVKGTGERLTVSGKIAIVWLQEKDKIEYLEYLEHLLEKGEITENIEDLELEKLQGAEGLRALRVEVVV